MLDRMPARPLTSREVAKIVSGLMAGMIEWCGSKTMIDALDHFIKYRDKYIEIWVEEEFKRIAKYDLCRKDNPPSEEKED